MTGAPLRVLVVDDTITYRMILKEVVRGIPDAEVAATAVDGEDALAKLRQNPVDLVLMDVEMPRMNGIDTMYAIRREFPGLGVVILSGANVGSANMTILALEAGAMDFVKKPDGASSTENIEALRKNLTPIVALVQGKRSQTASRAVESRSPSPPPVPPQAPSILSRIKTVPSRIDVLAIGVSTGGPKALGELIPALPGNLGVPVVIVQHMPPVFTASLAESLGRKSALKVKEAAAGEPLVANQVYIAPGGHHLALRRGASGTVSVVINDDPPENSCRPAVDVLFRSVAEAYGRNILAVILTGMGSDGAKGVHVIKNLPDTYCLTQSAETCVVYGMPKAVDDLALSDERLPLPDLAGRIASLIKGGVGAKAW